MNRSSVGIQFRLNPRVDLKIITFVPSFFQTSLSFSQTFLGVCLLGFACYFCIYINEQKKEREKPNEEKIMEKGEKKVFVCKSIRPCKLT